MTDRYTPYLDWIDAQRPRMVELVTSWASINSGSHNLQGLSELSAILRRDFASLGGEMAELPLGPLSAVSLDGRVVEQPLGRAISIVKRPAAPLRVFLCIHMDTVYGADDPFQRVEPTDANTLRGPGVADAKGGLAVMLVALEALERSEYAGRIGWEVLINPDEELGSPGSAPLLRDAARGAHLGLVFEPALPDGTLVAERMGSGNFTAGVRGRSAHVGRDFPSGRSAIHAAADFVTRVTSAVRDVAEAIVNFGRIDGGGPSNVVADLAICRFNVRVTLAQDQQHVERLLRQVADHVAAEHGVSVELSGSFQSPPKILSEETLRLMRHVEECGGELGLPIRWRATGGVCDGNRLAAAGLAVVDTMGVRGGGLHSPDEYLLLDSLTERAKLSALLLMKLAAGQIPWSDPCNEPIP